MQIKRILFLSLLLGFIHTLQFLKLRLSHISEASWLVNSFKLGFNSIWDENFQIYKLGLKRQRNKIKLQHSSDHGGSKGIPETHLLLLHSLDYLKASDFVDHNKL